MDLDQGQQFASPGVGLNCLQKYFLIFSFQLQFFFNFLIFFMNTNNIFYEYKQSIK